jgi:hypothetical protein
MTEKELREKVSQDCSEYSAYNEDYVFTEDPTEEYVSIGDEPRDDGFEEMQIDNSWNVINNQVLKNVLQNDPNVTSEVKNIANIYSSSIKTTTSSTIIKKITKDIQSPKCRK